MPHFFRTFAILNMPIELKVPSVGESITEVQIGDWLKAEGSRFEKDEPLVAIESEKATIELPAPSSGVLSKILKKKGQTAKVGEVVAHLEFSAASSDPRFSRNQQPSQAKRG